MTAITFRPAVRENVGLLILLSGGTGAGKSFSGLRLATGIAGEKKFAFIDTENRRGLHYADQFNFDYAEIRPPFRPEKFIEAVKAADKAGYPVIVIDSGSAVWAGSGGILDWQEEELDNMVERAKERNDNRKEWQIRESGKMAAWIKPKMSHKHMVQELLQVKAHVILCLRAEEKIEMIKDRNGKTVIQPKASLTGLNGWISVCEKSLPFEATVSILLMADKPGLPHPIKLQEQHKALFPLDKPITEESGKQLAAWATGGKAKSAPVTKPVEPTNGHVADIHTRPPDHDPDELTTIREDIEQLIALKVGTTPIDRKIFLKGQNLENMTIDALKQMQGDLAAL